MYWTNTETPTFAGAAGSNKAPAVAEAMVLYDRDGVEVARFIKTVSGALSLEVGAETVAALDAVSPTELGYLDGVTSAIQTQLNAKAPLASPTFTGTVSGITKAMVGLGSVDNTADTAKPVSTAQQTALDLKAPLASPTFTGTVTVPAAALDRTITPGGTTGNQTINKMAGTVNIAAGQTSVTVTNSLVGANSIVLAVIRTNDSTATIKNVVPGSGSFVITIASATAETSVGFVVLN